METNLQINRYVAAGNAVRRRIGWVRFADWLKCSHWQVGVAGIILVLLLRRLFEWSANELFAIACFLTAWVMAGLVKSLMFRPDSMEALVLLDRKGRWKDRFASAWAFLNSESLRSGERLHIEKASKELDQAVATFPTAMPLPGLQRIWIFPALAIIFAAIPLGRVSPEPGDMILTKQMVDSARSQAEEIKRESENVANLTALDEEERGQLEALRIQVDEVAGKLASADGLTAGEMLEALETRARAVEKLAEKLNPALNEWASREMVEEMGRHPDTADLALSIGDKAAEPAADEAQQIFDILDDPDINGDTSDRYSSSLENIMSVATDDDRTKPVGERVGNASTKMLIRQPRTAAREFEELAKHFRVLAERERSRAKLEQLAKSLREAGTEVSGSQLEEMEKLASADQTPRETPGGLQSLDADPLANELLEMLSPQNQGDQDGENPSLAPNGGGDAAPTAPPVPGMANATPPPNSGEGGSSMQALKAPVPGESPPQGEKGAIIGNSDQKGDESKGSKQLSAPIPGMEPADSGAGSPMQAAGGNSGRNGPPGQGGMEAGSGTAELVDTESTLFDASRDSKVEAQINKDGESSVSAIEGQARQEQAVRDRRQIVTDFIAAEEQALDEKSLPMSRREHVIRYFSAIRNQFEEKPETP